MPTNYDNDLLHEGIFHYKVKEYDLARDYIQRALENADDIQTQAQANYYLSLLTDDPAKKRAYLENTLAIDLTHAEARRALGVLEGKLNPSEIVDAETLRPASQEQVTVHADRFTCPKCGGRMVYSPDGVSLQCEYCRQDERLSTTNHAETQDFFIAMANGASQRSPTSVQIFGCQGCGANFVLGAEQISAICAYCGSPHVVAQEKKRQVLLPDSILPMIINRDQADSDVQRWLEAQKLVNRATTESPRGLYLPVWSFGIFGHVPWSGIIHRDKKAINVSGEECIDYEDVRITGSQKLAGLMVQALPEFDLQKASAYDPRFLTGWMAELYDLPMAEASLEARKVAVERVRAMLNFEHGEVSQLQYSSAALMVNSFKLILVPVWVTMIEARGQGFLALINGRTGSLVGEIPGGNSTRLAF